MISARAAMFASLSALAVVTIPALAQTPVEGAAADAGEAIIVTGTRRTDRTLADSPVPVDVISAEAILIRARPKRTSC